MITSLRWLLFGRRRPAAAAGILVGAVLAMAVAGFFGSAVAQDAPADSGAPVATDSGGADSGAASDVASPSASVPDGVAPDGRASTPLEPPADDAPRPEAATVMTTAGPPGDTAATADGSFPDVEPLTPEEAAAMEEAAREAEDAEGQIDYYKTFLLLLTLAVLIVVPIFLARWICARARTPEYTFRIWATLFCLLASAVVVYRLPTTLGIDLSGGVILIYEVSESKTDEDAEQAQEEKDEEAVEAAGEVKVDMDKMAVAIARRVDPSGVREISVQKLGRKQIKVIIPRADENEVARLEGVISDAGSLEFRILAHGTQHAELIREARSKPDEDKLFENGKLVARWVTVMEDAKAEFMAGLQPGARYAARMKGEELQVLVIQDSYDVTGQYLVNSRSTYDPKSGKPCVGFTFNSRGGRLFAGLTTDYGPDPTTGTEYQLGIILSDHLKSAPNINEPIHENGVITSPTFDQEEVDNLVAVLNAGSLPANLSQDPVSRFHTGPTLGADTIAAGKIAIGISAIVVLIFMVFYYRFAGLIACFAVVMNLLMILGTMKVLHAAFTLPGLAGLVLTVGMAVDANVLIFERIREELDRKATIRMAIRNGFQKAWTTIFDANITTLLTAIILYWVGSEQIKGFAVTLFLGIVYSMFTAIYCSRAIFDIAEKTGRLKRLYMMRIIGHTDWDFLSKRYVCGAISVVLILVGLVAVSLRGKGLLDIDFVGGVSIETVFNSPQEIGTIRTELAELPDLQVNGVKSMAEDGGPSESALAMGTTHFIINTASPPDVEAEDYLHQVKALLREKFGEELKRYSMDFEFTGDETNARGKTVTKAELVFPQKVNYDTLDTWLAEEIEELNTQGDLPADVMYQLTNPQYGGARDNQSYENWTLSIELPEEMAARVLGDVQAQVNATPYFPSSSTIGGSVAAETRWRAIAALTLALASIIAYIWFRFHGVIFGIAAVVALVHDVLITLGLLAISKWVATPLAFLQVSEFKIGLPVLAAFLTLIGYSLNDTIVVFDRMREVRGKAPDLTYAMMNTSLNQTLSRTLLTSLTTFFVVLILYFLGGPGIHTFAFALVVGVIVGTYSSVYVASPVLHWLFQLTRQWQD